MMYIHSTYRPELYEVFQWSKGNIYTVYKSVSQKHHEELVGGKANAVIHPENSKQEI